MPLPAHISFEQGAGLGIPFITAHGCLFSDGDITGQSILIAGGAGAVGNAAIQIAKRAEAHVLTTISSHSKAALAQAAGADEIINYKTSDAKAVLQSFASNGVNRVVEVALTTNLELDLGVLANGGTVVTYSTEDEDPRIPVGKSMGRHYTFKFFLVYTMTNDAIADAIDFITAVSVYEAHQN